MCLQNELSESNIILYDNVNADESIKKIGSVLTSIIESVDKERVSTYCTWVPTISVHRTTIESKASFASYAITFNNHDDIDI